MALFAEFSTQLISDLPVIKTPLAIDISNADALR